jgi:hypothetical protein
MEIYVYYGFLIEKFSCFLYFLEKTKNFEGTVVVLKQPYGSTVVNSIKYVKKIENLEKKN